MANPIKDLIETAIDSMDGLFTAESIIGDTVTAADGTMIIPIARVAFGVGGGGSEFKETDAAGNNLFGGGVGAGASIRPEGFLVITKSGSIRFVSTDEGAGPIEKLIELAPDMVDRISGIFNKKKNNGDTAEE
ncbi:MAG: spore germination protein GerW family protein [Clostridiales bacterium]|nr:spore germination protein GerW family protein [Clostridiales bacterium]